MFAFRIVLSLDRPITCVIIVIDDFFQVMAKRQMKELDEKKGGKGSRGARGENSDDEGDSEAVVGNFKVKKKTKLASGGGGGGGKVTKKKFKK